MACGRLMALVIALTVTLPGFARAQEKERLKADEDFLRESGIGTDGAALLEFFRVRTPGEKALESMKTLLAMLGNDSFQVRQQASEELLRIGPQALGQLRPLISNTDPEVASRARTCVSLLEKSVRPDLMSAAVRVLADRKPANATRTLLAYLPAAGDSMVIEEIHTALSVVGFKDGKPEEILVKALADRRAVCRAAAAEAIIRGGKEADRQAVRQLLKDPESKVRITTALALVEKKDRDAVQPLIESLADASSEHFWRIEQILFSLAGDDAPKLSPGDSAAEKQAYRLAWNKWWQEKGKTVDLAALDKAGRLLGLTTIVTIDNRAVGGRLFQGRVTEIGPDGKQRWEIKDLTYPVDAQVLGRDRVLVAEYRARSVTERNLKGEAVWTKPINTFPVGVQRLDNGNTLIAQRTEVIEVNPAGNEVFQWRTQGGMIIAARRSRNGETVVLDSMGSIYRLDNKGQVKKTTRTGLNVTSVIGTHIDVLPNGHVLIPFYPQNKVMEFDADGKKVWEATADRPTSCSRLPNGNTLLCSRYSNQVTEIDRKGNTVWKYTAPQGTVIQARRR